MNSRTILAIDPGTTHSAFCQYRAGQVLDHGWVPNTEMRQVLIGREYDAVAIEMIASYGMAVGASTFETCVWIGRFVEVARVEPVLCYRKDIKLFLCGSMRAKDANIRARLLDLVGPQGTKAKPGPTYGIKSHTWAPLAVAVFASESNNFLRA